jgi:hypothetical protein
MSQLNQELNDSLPAHIYYDLQISNFDTITQKPQQFHYNNANSIAYLQNPELYDLAIQKFQIDTGTAPVFIPSIERNQPDINKTIYSVTLGVTINDVSYYSDQISVMWIPQDLTADVPVPTNRTDDGFQDNHGGYYFCYSYAWFTNLVNLAYANALISLIANTTGIVDADVNPPKIYWENSSASAVLLAQLAHYNLGDPDHYSIFMNTALNNLYNSFNATLETYNSGIGANYRIYSSQTFGDINVVDLPDNDGTNDYYIKMTQEYSTIMSWAPFSAIVFTSNTIPVLPNIVNPTLIYSNNQIVSSGSTDTNSESIITDLTSSDGQYRGGMTYVPSAEYRRITLFGNQPISNLDLNIYFRTKLGNLVPFRLSSGGSVMLKLGFFKK